MSNERHFRAAPAVTSFAVEFNGSNHEVEVTATDSGYDISVDGVSTSYGKVNPNAALVDFGADIVQPISIKSNAVKLQFQGMCTIYGRFFFV